MSGIHAVSIVLKVIDLRLELFLVSLKEAGFELAQAVGEMLLRFLSLGGRLNRLSGLLFRRVDIFGGAMASARQLRKFFSALGLRPLRGTCFAPVNECAAPNKN